MDPELERISNTAHKMLIAIEKEDITEMEKIAALKSAAAILENHVVMKSMTLAIAKTFNGGGR